MEEYTDISGITGAGDRHGMGIQDNYMFDALIRAIDFFSQKFNLETIIDFAGDFINEILTLGSSAQFIFEEESGLFQIRKKRLYNSSMTSLPDSKQLQNIAALYGTIITDNFHSFLPEKFIEEYKPALLIPLIHADKLIGFIITSGKAMGDFEDDDYSMAKAIMRLFNNAFERNFYLVERSSREKQLDTTKFELYTVNKTSKVLFAEINLDNLLVTALEIFSEVSGSRITAFAIKDDANKSLVVKAFKDARRNTECPADFHLYFCDNPVFTKDKCIFEVNKDFEELSKIFKNPERFQQLEAEYVVLIVKERILGFVTLGTVKTTPVYDEEKLEIVNSLAISCFVALNNAMVFSEIVEQKKDLEARYNSLLKYKI